MLEIFCLLDEFRVRVLGSMTDFAENYSFLEVQNEIQERHYHSNQMTILVHITYRHHPQYNPSIGSSLKNIKEYLNLFE